MYSWTDEQAAFLTRKGLDPQKFRWDGMLVTPDIISLPVPFSRHFTKVVGYVIRHFNIDRKYTITNKAARSALFGNHLLRTKTCVLVEGAWDAIPLQLAGIPAVAVVGTIINNIQIHHLRRYFTSVLLCVDNDKAGNDFVVRLEPRLQEYGLRVSSLIPPDENTGAAEVLLRYGKGPFIERLKFLRTGFN